MKHEVEMWLEASGEERACALQSAVEQLLSNYKDEFPFPPVSISGLAASVGAKISRVKDMPGGGSLMPRRDGFSILISTDLPQAKFRMAVAHEVAHTLFYSKEEGKMPKRLIPPTEREHQFCFDVARHLLAPRWLLAKAGILKGNDSLWTFHKLISLFRLSKPTAARLMLEDYKLSIGIAGRWICRDKGWEYISAGGCASPLLDAEGRRELRDIAKQWLTNRQAPRGVKVLGIPEPLGGATMFLLVEKREVF